MLIIPLNLEKFNYPENKIITKFSIFQFIFEKKKIIEYIFRDTN